MAHLGRLVASCTEHQAGSKTLFIPVVFGDLEILDGIFIIFASSVVCDYVQASFPCVVTHISCQLHTGLLDLCRNTHKLPITYRLA
jgi:hypothetical protein